MTPKEISKLFRFKAIINEKLKTPGLNNETRRSLEAQAERFRTRIFGPPMETMPNPFADLQNLHRKGKRVRALVSRARRYDDIDSEIRMSDWLKDIKVQQELLIGELASQIGGSDE